MEELFRFTLTRPADRTETTTVPLQHNTQLQDMVAGAAKTGPAQDSWASIQKLALDFIKANLSTWIASLAGQTSPAPTPFLALRQLLTALQAVQPGSLPATWIGPIQTASTAISAADLATWHGNLADLFLALMIIRSMGPAAIDKVIRSAVISAPVVPPILQPSNSGCRFRRVRT